MRDVGELLDPPPLPGRKSARSARQVREAGLTCRYDVRNEGTKDAVIEERADLRRSEEGAARCEGQDQE